MNKTNKNKEKEIEDDWKDTLKTCFGNGEVKNETISGYLGNLIHIVQRIVDKEERNAYWEGKGDDW